MKRTWLIFIAVTLFFLAAVGLILGQLFLPGPGVVVGKSTTHITTPLAADGLPDYAAYLLDEGSKGVTPENNGAIPFLQAMWPAELKPEHQLPICKHLGMEVPAARGMGYPTEDDTFKKALLAWLEKKYPPQEATDGEGVEGEKVVWGEYGTQPTPDERMWEVLGHAESYPWKRDQFPLLAQWIDDHAGHYDLLHEAAGRPKFHLPPPELLTEPEAPLLSITLSSVQAMRTAANCLAMRANLHLGEGDVAAAWKDCEAMYRLARHSSFDSLVNELVNIAVTGVADALVLDILDSQHLTPEVARQIHAFQQSRTPRQGMTAGLDNGERLMFVTTILAMAGERGDGQVTMNDLTGGGSEMPPLEKLSVNWNLVLEKGNACYDRIVAASRIEDRAARRAAQDQVEDEFIASVEEMAKQIPAAIFSRTARSEAMGDWLLSRFIPALQAATHAEDRSNVHQQLHQVAAALAVHRLGQGEYPEKLDELVPGLLKALPIDIYGQPLVYRRAGDGYILYSLGANGTDDQGSNEMMSTFQGYSVGEEKEAAVRELLGLPALQEQQADMIGEFAGEELEDAASLSLEKQIPGRADDWSLRLPLPQVEFPLENSGELKEE